jgi:hypothetical protein
MRDTDYHEFTAMLDQVANVLTRGQYKPDAAATALWFRALSAYELAQVRAAFDAHMHDPDRGRFFPTPADIIGKAVGRGRPKPDEAWAIALKAIDESASLQWTDEIAEAWGIAKPVLDAGDEVGARMAFREAYERICVERGAQPVRWWQSIGHADKVAIEAADPNALRLPAPTLEQIAGNAPPHIREKLLALRDELDKRTTGASGVEIDPEITRTRYLQERAQELTDRYQRQHPQEQEG